MIAKIDTLQVERVTTPAQSEAKDSQQRVVSFAVATATPREAREWLRLRDARFSPEETAELARIAAWRDYDTFENKTKTGGQS